MSPYTTLRITRKKAIEVIMRELLGDISNYRLEEWMNDYLKDKLYDCVIFPEFYEDNDDDIV